MVIVKEAAVGNYFQAYEYRWKRRMTVSPFALSTSEGDLWLAAWTARYNISLLVVFFAS